MHSFHPLLVMLKSDAHCILSIGVTPEGPDVPVYESPPSTMR
jgi:hypothetical protein